MACERCGALLHTGEARVIVPFTARELEDLIFASGGEVRARLLCALGLIDHDAYLRVVEELRA